MTTYNANINLAKGTTGEITSGNRPNLFVHNSTTKALNYSPDGITIYDYPTSSSVAAGLATKFNTSGGTITGNVSANNLVLRNPSATQTISGAALIIQRPELSGSTFATRQLPDTWANFIIEAGGKHKWGTSASDTDTFLERAGNNHLRTSGTFTARNTIRVTGFDSAASIAEGGPSVEINYISASNFGRIISYDRTATSAKPFVIGSKDTTVLVGEFMTVSAAKFTDTVNTFYLPISGTSISGTGFYDSSFTGNKVLVSSPTKELVEGANLTYNGTTLEVGMSAITNPKIVISHNNGIAGGPELIIGGAAGPASDNNSGKLQFGIGNTGFRHIATTEPKYKFQRYNLTTSAFENVWALDNASTSNKDVTFYGSVIAPTISATSITVGSIDNTEFQYLNGSSANIQVQLSNLSANSHTHANKSTLDLINQSLNSSASPTFDKVFTTNDGGGQNIRIGNDAWIGDVNQANTIAIRGVSSSATGYVRFGTDSNSFGYDGSNLVYPGSLSIGSGLSANAFYDSNYVGNRALVSGPNKEIIESTLIAAIELDQLEGVSANIQNQLSNLSARPYQKLSSASNTIGPIPTSGYISVSASHPCNPGATTLITLRDQVGGPRYDLYIDNTFVMSANMASQDGIWCYTIESNTFGIHSIYRTEGRQNNLATATPIFTTVATTPVIPNQVKIEFRFSNGAGYYESNIFKWSSGTW